MSAHQAHRLPWATLAEIYRSVSVHDGRYSYDLTAKQEKQLWHFARCLSDALQEFATTDRRPPEDDEGNSLDPTTWGIHPTGFGGYTGYYISLLQGYVHLNLLLMDSKVFKPILQRGQKSAPPSLYEPCGIQDGSHPEWMARRLRPILMEGGNRLEPLTAERLQIIRDHCALLFRCLYSISAGNRALDPEFVAQCITPV